MFGSKLRQKEQLAEQNKNQANGNTQPPSEFVAIMQKCDEHGFFIEKDLYDANSEASKAHFNRENARVTKWLKMIPDLRSLIKEGDEKRREILT